MTPGGGRQQLPAGLQVSTGEPHQAPRLFRLRADVHANAREDVRGGRVPGASAGVRSGGLQKSWRSFGEMNVFVCSRWF